MRFSDLFRSQDQEASTGTDSGAGQDGDAKVVAGFDGLRLESESYSRNQEGEESYDRTSIDSGDTGLSSTVAADKDLEQASDLSTSPDGSPSDSPDEGASTSPDGGSSGPPDEGSSTSSSESRSNGDSDGGENGRTSSSGNAESDTGADQSAGASASARNDGVRAENESYSRDEDGEVSYDRTSADTGASDAGFDLDVETMTDSFSGLSGSWDDSGIFD